MRRLPLLAALLVSFVMVLPGCNLASRNRVQAINRMNEGIQLFDKNNTAGAEKALQDAIQLDPTYGAAFANWRINPNNGEVRGASVYFSSLWARIANSIFTDDTTLSLALGRGLGNQVAAATDSPTVQLLDAQSRVAAVRSDDDSVRPVLPGVTVRVSGVVRPWLTPRQ